MTEQAPKPPRAFISYSWTSPDHEDLVLQLATDLVENGVDVVLDKWNLREGDDKFAFMERMVTDKTVDKVIAVCDALYAEKADGREGGVGTETQIISKEVYEQVDSEDRPQRFVAVVVELDKNGHACVPTFLKARIHIDMTDSDLREEKFEQLLRWLFGKPLHKKPSLGTPPSYVFAERELSLGTSAKHRRALDCLRQQKHNALAAASDFLETFAEKIEETRVEMEPRDSISERIYAAIESSLPYRDEVIDVFLALAKYQSAAELESILRRFFEQLLPLGYWPKNTDSWIEGLADNFTFLNQELFLYCIASLLKNECFDVVNDLLARDYYFPPTSTEVQDRMVAYSEFNRHCDHIVRYYKLQEQRKLSPLGDLIKVRANRTDLRFEDLMQADFVLFLRGIIREADWWPYTLVYATRVINYPFELFARSQSLAYFTRAKQSLGVSDIDELRKLLLSTNSPMQVPAWQGRPINPSVLANVKLLCTQP